MTTSTLEPSALDTAQQRKYRQASKTITLLAAATLPQLEANLVRFNWDEYFDAEMLLDVDDEVLIRDWMKPIYNAAFLKIVIMDPPRGYCFSNDETAILLRAGFSPTDLCNLATAQLVASDDPQVDFEETRTWFGEQLPGEDEEDGPRLIGSIEMLQTVLARLKDCYGYLKGFSSPPYGEEASMEHVLEIANDFIYSADVLQTVRWYDENRS